MSDSNRELAFYAQGLRAAVTEISGRCLFEVAIEPEHHSMAKAVRLEVLLQPCDGRGLPHGFPALLYEATIKLCALAGSERLHGWTWLPVRLAPDLAARCHFRVTPIRIAAPSSG